MYSEIDELKASKQAAANSSKSKLSNQVGRKGTPIRGKGGCEKNGISEHHKEEMGTIPLWLNDQQPENMRDTIPHLVCLSRLTLQWFLLI